jgi:hypothetical protein
MQLANQHILEKEVAFLKNELARERTAADLKLQRAQAQAQA